MKKIIAVLASIFLIFIACSKHISPSAVVIIQSTPTLYATPSFTKSTTLFSATPTFTQQYNTPTNTYTATITTPTLIPTGTNVTTPIATPTMPVFTTNCFNPAMRCDYAGYGGSNNITVTFYMYTPFAPAILGVYDYYGALKLTVTVQADSTGYGTCVINAAPLANVLTNWYDIVLIKSGYAPPLTFGSIPDSDIYADNKIYLQTIQPSPTCTPACYCVGPFYSDPSRIIVCNTFKASDCTTVFVTANYETMHPNPANGFNGPVKIGFYGPDMALRYSDRQLAMYPDPDYIGHTSFLFNHTLSAGDPAGTWHAVIFDDTYNVPNVCSSNMPGSIWDSTFTVTP